MRAVDIIQKKRDKIELSKTEIVFLLNSYLNGDLPDYQMSSFCMAVFFNGMTVEELNCFTDCMMNSGDLIKFEGINKFLIDKHSTGGVGDKTTVSLGPIFSAFGIGTAKLSGRGLGHTGGTIDKFESIPGFFFPETRDDMIAIVNKTGIGIMGYSDKIVPLDKKLYSLRDVTATVPSIPLIASSIMSKKLAVYADGIILDVKIGSGAFMKTVEEARKLAETMLLIGKGFGRKVVAVLTNMDQPLGCAVGNSLEIIEAVETLKGKGPEDFTELVETISAVALMLKGDVENLEEGMKKVLDVIKSGTTLSYLKSFIEECSGDASFIEDYSKLPGAEFTEDVIADFEGYVEKIEAEEIGKAAMVLGAGRATKEDVIDHGVGVVLNKKVGDKVSKGDVLAKLYHNGKEAETAKKMILDSYCVSQQNIGKPSVVVDIIKNF